MPWAGGSCSDLPPPLAQVSQSSSMAHWDASALYADATANLIKRYPSLIKDKDRAALQQVRPA